MEIKLRRWREADAPDVAKSANNRKVADNLRDGFPIPYTEMDALQWLRSVADADEDLALYRAIEVDGVAAGSIGLFRQDNVYRMTAEIGYWLGEPYWGQGIVTRAIRLLSAEGFASWDIVRIYAEPFAHNKGSRRALEKAGFALEAVLKDNVIKNGAVMDSCIYALLRRELPEDSL